MNAANYDVATLAVVPTGIGGIKIRGYNVMFPEGKSPFPAQKGVISKALEALDAGMNALLESPTGTGKTLALLTSTLCWHKKRLELQREIANQASDSHQSTLSNSSSNHKCDNDVTASAEQKTTTDSAVSGTNVRHKHKQIFYCSRTHSQLKQVINESRNCHPDYLSTLTTTVLASRSQLCVNAPFTERNAHETTFNLDEACREAIKIPSTVAEKDRCHKAHVKKVLDFSHAIRTGSVWDIEDIVAAGKSRNSCPYFTSRLLLEDADLVFAPYNYLLTPSIRDRLKINLEGSVVIFDEAHNIENVARDACSAEITQAALNSAVEQLARLANSGYSTVAFKGLHGLLVAVADWLDVTAERLQSSDGGYNDMQSMRNNPDDRPEVWIGAEAVRVFADSFGLTANTLEVFQEYFRTVISEQDDVAAIVKKIQSEGDDDDTDANAPRGSLQYESDFDNKSDDSNDNEALTTIPTSTIIVLKSLLFECQMMLQNDAADANDFRMVVLKPSTFNHGNPSERKAAGATLCFWCLNANLAFRELNEKCNSILLTSGTLAPLDSFEGDLGIPFPIKVEANHVIDTKKQVMVEVTSSVQNTPIVCTYQHQDSHEMLDAVGELLRTTSRITPGGCLMFFPSYSMMDKAIWRWKESGIYNAIEGDSTALQRTPNINFSDVSKDKSSSGRRLSGKPRRHQQKAQLLRQFPIYCESRDSRELETILTEYFEAVDRPGGKAILLAVSRGKVSEGIDFKDEYARSVIVVGIPYPNIADLHVNLKRNYQNAKALTNPVIFNGTKWLSQQAFRAINQSVGRCIRHKRDFGLVLLCDGRFGKEDSLSQLSKWVRSSVQQRENFHDIISPLMSFFRRNSFEFLAEERYSEYYPRFEESGQMTSSAPSLPSSKQHIDDDAEGEDPSLIAASDSHHADAKTNTSDLTIASKVDKRRRKLLPPLSSVDSVAIDAPIVKLAETAIARAFAKAHASSAAKTEEDHQPDTAVEIVESIEVVAYCPSRDDIASDSWTDSNGCNAFSLPMTTQVDSQQSPNQQPLHKDIPHNPVTLDVQRLPRETLPSIPQSGNTQLRGFIDWMNKWVSVSLSDSEQDSLRCLMGLKKSQLIDDDDDDDDDDANAVDLLPHYEFVTIPDQLSFLRNELSTGFKPFKDFTNIAAFSYSSPSSPALEPFMVYRLSNDSSTAMANILESRLLATKSLHTFKYVDRWVAADEVVYRKWLLPISDFHQQMLCNEYERPPSEDPSDDMTGIPFLVRIVGASKRSMALLDHIYIHPFFYQWLTWDTSQRRVRKMTSSFVLPCPLDEVIAEKPLHDETVTEVMGGVESVNDQSAKVASVKEVTDLTSSSPLPLRLPKNCATADRLAPVVMKTNPLPTTTACIMDADSDDDDSNCQLNDLPANWMNGASTIASASASTDAKFPMKRHFRSFSALNNNLSRWKKTT